MLTATKQWFTLPVLISCYCFVCTQANSGSVYFHMKFAAFRLRLYKTQFFFQCLIAKFKANKITFVKFFKYSTYPFLWLARVRASHFHIRKIAMFVGCLMDV